MRPGRTFAVLLLGLLGSAVVYSLMMAVGDPALELLICAGWLPVYLLAYAIAYAGDRPAPVSAPTP